jgi:Flp pilus assembly protein TadD
MLEKRPDDVRLRFGLALEYLAADRLDDGVRELTAYLAVADDEGNAWGRLGAVLRRAGRDVEAREAYLKGIEAAHRHGHPTMAEEFEGVLEEWGP